MWSQSATKKQVNLFPVFRLRLGGGFGQLPGDVGLTGHTVTEDDGVQRPYYSILVGGSVGEGRGRIGKRLGRYREEDASAAVAALARFFERERTEGERFPEFVDRIGMPRLTEIAKASVTSRAA